MCELGRDREEVGGHVVAKDRTCRLNGDEMVSRPEGIDQFTQIWLQHGFAATDDDVLDGLPWLSNRENLRYTVLRALRMPGGVFGVAPDTPKIAPGCADEDARMPGESAFSLQCLVDLVDQHSVAMIAAGFGEGVI